MGIWQDNSGRLTVDLPGITALDYPAVCRVIAEVLGLEPTGDIIIGPEQTSQDFRKGDHVIGLDWDIWMDFMAVAKAKASEPLLQDIAEWLKSSRWRSVVMPTEG